MSGSMRWFALGSALLVVLAIAVGLLVLNRDAGLAENEAIGGTRSDAAVPSAGTSLVAAGLGTDGDEEGVTTL